MIERVNKGILQLAIVALMISAPLTPAHAGIVGTDVAIAMSERADAVARINGTLMRDDVRAQLQALGVSPQDALERVAALTDRELMELEARLDELPAGAGVLEVIGIVLVVLLILELLGVTNVFTGI